MSKSDELHKDGNYYSFSPGNLIKGTTYYWRVRLKGYENHYGPWSNTFSFVTDSKTAIKETVSTIKDIAT